MPRALYALLVGIDKYPEGTLPLRGCVNDANTLASYLQESVGMSGGCRLLLLLNEQATRQAVIDAFRWHLGRAEKEDVALFYFAGYGSQGQTPPEFWNLQPDHLDDTLVCFDSRQPGSWDLADKELSKLLYEVAARGPHLAVVLDCCHSGSGSRDLVFQETPVRRLWTDVRWRPREAYLVTPDGENELSSRDSAMDASGGASYVLLAACRADEYANEIYVEGRMRGAFSSSLEAVLRRGGGGLSYRDLFARVSALVQAQVRNQSPQLVSNRPEAMEALFLGGLAPPASVAFIARFRQGGWYINAGASHGLPAGEPAATLALFSFDASPEDLRDPARAAATARTAAVGADSSRLEILDGHVDRATGYRAVVIDLPNRALAVRLEGDAAGCALASEALAPSSFVREGGVAEQPAFRLIAADGQYVIARPGDDRPLAAPIAGLTKAKAGLAVRHLEHIARWTLAAQLSNPTSTIKSGDVKLRILVEDQEVTGPEVRLEYRPDTSGKWHPPTFKFSLTNTSERSLYCALLDLTQSFGVSAGMTGRGCVHLAPGETAWGNDGHHIHVLIPDEFWQRGIIEYKDLLKLIVSTQEFDARLLEQSDLEEMVEQSARPFRSPSRNSTLNRQLLEVQTRDLSGGTAEAIDDWQAFEFSFTTVRPLVAHRLCGEEAVALLEQVYLEGHPRLRAAARLNTVALATRDQGAVPLPQLLKEDSRVSEPCSFATAFGADPLSVLELEAVEDSDAVTPDAPLTLRLPGRLAANENLLPVAFDGEFFLPLGRADRPAEGPCRALLERLPPPVADSRSIEGTIRVFFYKVRRPLSAAAPEGPALAARGAAGQPEEHDPSRVRAQVALARRVLVHVPGVVGDHRGLARLVTAPGASGDMVLTFDYDALKTGVVAAARALRQCLETVGLGPGHGKQLHLVADSSGGLVARWLVEREGGNSLVKRLLLLGAMNQGWPWPSLRDWATVMLGAGLNKLAELAWPAGVLGDLAAVIDADPEPLRELLSGSDLLADLASSPDPGIPYTVLAGTTSVLSAAIVPQFMRATTNSLGRLLERLSPGLAAAPGAQDLLGGLPNDLVSVASSGGLFGARRYPAEVRWVPCDHLTYFTAPAGFQPLAGVLAEET
jgi:hypothetical protein